MNSIIPHTPASVTSIEPIEVPSNTLEMIRNDKYLDEELRKMLLAKPGFLARISPTQKDREIMGLQTELTNVIRQYIVHSCQETLNDRLLRLSASLRADTVLFCHQEQSKVMKDLSDRLRSLTALICEDIAFCQQLPDGFVREEYEQAIRDNYRAMLQEYKRTNEYFNKFLETQIQSKRLFEE